MGDKSAIEWTDATWNPLLGCTKVSAGCTHCYAIRVARRNADIGQKAYQGLTKRLPDGSVNWTGAVRMLEERLTQPLTWKRPRRIFVNSMSDLFHPSVPDEFIDQVFAVMKLAYWHSFQVLTKRPERLMQWATRGLNASSNGATPAYLRVSLATQQHFKELVNAIRHHADGDRAIIDSGEFADVWPLPNVWLGTSVEDQKAADERIPWLLQTPAAVRWLSCEPLLGPVDLTAVRHQLRGESYMISSVLEGDDGFGLSAQRNRIDWVVAGGESGGPAERRLVERCTHVSVDGKTGPCPGFIGSEHETLRHRACGGTGWLPRLEPLAWARQLRDQCQTAGVPFLFKQWGGPTPKSGGRELDGRTWDEYPTPAAVVA